MAGIVWWEVETERPEEFQRFHEAMWGWEFHPAFAETAIADYWVIVFDGRGIGGLQRGSGVPSVGTRVYLEVDDLEAVLAVAEAFGAEVERTRTAIAGDARSFARFRDPVGISFGLWCETPPAP